MRVDDSDFTKKASELLEKVQGNVTQAVRDVASEILRLSISGPPAEVPHDKGSLQSSSQVEDVDETESIVGFNTTYAARLHEHPEYQFQKGRKGKFLEDPIKNNSHTFVEYFRKLLS